MARRSLGKKDIIRKRLEIANSRSIKKKRVFNQFNRPKPEPQQTGEIEPLPKKVALSNGQVKKVNTQIRQALRKSTKTKSAMIIGGGSRFDRSAIRSGVYIPKKKYHRPFYTVYPSYEKKENVDFDVAICISSYNRYDKISQILKQLFEQESKYTFKVFVLNDGSTQKKREYDELVEKYPEIIYLKNRINGGKYNYWQTVTKLWLEVKEYDVHGLCQMDDDFVLCNNFVDNLMSRFFMKKEEDNGYMAFRYHLASFNDEKFTQHDNLQSVDGGTLFDTYFLEKIDYTIPQQKLNSAHDDSKIWNFLTKKIREFGMKVNFYDSSLVFHDGNFDSKLHPYIRKFKTIDTKKFIGD
jgi:hypothetical protein